MELLISIVIGILIVEAYAWLPRLSHLLIDLAVQRLRKEDQDRCREEWSADLAALPNTVVRLVHAVSCLAAAHKINLDFFETRLTVLDADIEELDRKQSGMIMSFRKAKDSLHRLGTTQRQMLDKHRAELRTQLVAPPNKEVESSWQSLMRNMEQFIDTYGNAADRSRKLLSVCIDRTGDRLTYVKGLIIKARRKRDQLTELLGRRDVSPDRFDALLVDLANDLNAVKNIFADDKWGDDDALREHKRLRAILHNAVQSLGTQRA
jgi:hypothetical protein